MAEIPPDSVTSESWPVTCDGCGHDQMRADTTVVAGTKTFVLCCPSCGEVVATERFTYAESTAFLCGPGGGRMVFRNWVKIHDESS